MLCARAQQNCEFHFQWRFYFLCCHDACVFLPPHIFHGVVVVVGFKFTHSLPHSMFVFVVVYSRFFFARIFSCSCLSFERGKKWGFGGAVIPVSIWFDTWVSSECPRIHKRLRRKQQQQQQKRRWGATTRDMRLNQRAIFMSACSPSRWRLDYVSRFLCSLFVSRLNVSTKIEYAISLFVDTIRLCRLCKYIVRYIMMTHAYCILLLIRQMTIYINMYKDHIFKSIFDRRRTDMPFPRLCVYYLFFNKIPFPIAYLVSPQKEQGY